MTQLADPPSLTVVDAGRVAYEEALALQRALAEAKKTGRTAEDVLLLLEHEPVVTFGRGASAQNLTTSPGLLAAPGIRSVEIERGGDVTYHGPGQLVGYPILDLTHYRRDLHWYMRRLEEALIRALKSLGVTAFRVAGYTGVWVGEHDGGAGDVQKERAASLVRSGRIRKIASIGVHVSRWVTWHGFALNVTDEPLANFELIVPCGIDGVRMTSLASEGRGLAGPRDEALVRAVTGGFHDAFETSAPRTTEDVQTLYRLAGIHPATVHRPAGTAQGERSTRMASS
jgi:lipoate-protein ligase B